MSRCFHHLLIQLASSINVGPMKVFTIIQITQG